MYIMGKPTSARVRIQRNFHAVGLWHLRLKELLLCLVYDVLRPGHYFSLSTHVSHRPLICIRII